MRRPTRRACLRPAGGNPARPVTRMSRPGAGRSPCQIAVAFASNAPNGAWAKTSARVPVVTATEAEHQARDEQQHVETKARQPDDRAADDARNLHEIVVRKRSGCGGGRRIRARDAARVQVEVKVVTRRMVTPRATSTSASRVATACEWRPAPSASGGIVRGAAPRGTEASSESASRLRALRLR